MKIKLLTPLLCLGITACSATQPEVLGGDRDTHGCIPSAGYSWCESTKTCVRPWELADTAKIENSEAAVKAYCDKI
jgi:hypothetical protein